MRERITVTYKPQIWERGFYALSLVIFLREVVHRMNFYRDNFDTISWLWPLRDSFMTPTLHISLICFVSIIFIFLIISKKMHIIIGPTVWTLAIALLNSAGGPNHSINIYFLVSLALFIHKIAQVRDYSTEIFSCIMASTMYLNSGIWKLRHLLEHGFSNVSDLLPHQISVATLEFNTSNLQLSVIKFLEAHPIISGLLWISTVILMIGMPLLIIFRPKVAIVAIMFFLLFHVFNIYLMGIYFIETIILWLYFFIIFLFKQKKFMPIPGRKDILSLRFL